MSVSLPAVAATQGRTATPSPAAISAVAAVVCCGAIFGFFYAWVCSTMWGLDAADPRVAIEAMQAMNASVRNFVFFPAFFLTPVVVLTAALLSWRERRATAAALLLSSGLLYLVGGLGLTLAVNVPMNDALAQVQVTTAEESRQVWSDYSSRWQVFNQIRTAVSGVSLLLAAVALAHLRPARPTLTGSGDGSTRQ